MSDKERERRKRALGRISKLAIVIGGSIFLGSAIMFGEQIGGMFGVAVGAFSGIGIGMAVAA